MVVDAALGAGLPKRGRVQAVPGARHDQRALGLSAASIPTDITDSSQVLALVAEVLERWGRIDVLVNNAGIGYHGPFETMSLDDFEKVLQVNLLGAVRCLHAVVPIMLRQKAGHIVNVASAHGRRAHPRYAAYSASKFALCGLSDTLRVELAPHGIDVLTYCPPLTESRFFANALHSVGQMKPGRRGAAPEWVAAQIVDAAWRRKREVIGTMRDKVLICANKFAPTLVDFLLALRYESKLRNSL